MFTYQTPTRHALLAVRKRALNLQQIEAMELDCWQGVSYVECAALFVSQQSGGRLKTGRRSTETAADLIPEQLPEVDVLTTERDDCREVVRVKRRPHHHVRHRLYISHAATSASSL